MRRGSRIAVALGVWLALASSTAQAATSYPQLASDLEAFTGARTKIVWNGGDMDGSSGEGLFVFDSASGACRKIFDGSGWRVPHITPCGNYVLFNHAETSGDQFKNDGCYIYNLTTNSLQWFLQGTEAWQHHSWHDPATGYTWVYVSDANNAPWSVNESLGSVVYRHRLDNPSIRELVYEGDISCWFTVSGDGLKAGGCFPFNSCGVLDIATGSYQQYGLGCDNGVSPDDRHNFFKLNFDHTGITFYNAGASNPRTVSLNAMVPGQRIWHPRWSNHNRYITLKAPELGVSNVWLGRFNEGYTQIEEWLQVTDTSVSDGWSYAWVEPTDAMVRVDSFQSDPASIEAGETATLTWSVVNATSVSIEPGIGTVDASGSTTVTPSDTTTYTLTALGLGGSAISHATVTVSLPSGPDVVVFTAAPGSIEQGGAATLTWDTTDAVSATIEPDVGAVAVDGTATVTPPATTTYTLTALTDDGVPSTATVTVTVMEPPSLTVDAPVADEVWYVGTTRRVRYTAFRVEEVLGFYTTDGSTWTDLFHAYAGNVGWQSHEWTVPDAPTPSCTILVQDYMASLADQVTIEIRAVVDGDGDGMDDDWETVTFGDLSHDETSDADGDGLTDYDEFMDGTDPLVPEPEGFVGTGVLSCAARGRGDAGAAGPCLGLLVVLVGACLTSRRRAARSAAMNE